MGASFPPDLNSVVYCITWMPWFPRHYSIAWKNAAKLILWRELGNLVSIFFQKVWVFPWYSMIYFITCEMNGCCNQFAANFPQHPSYRESLEYWHLHFSQSMDVCLPSYSNRMITLEMLEFSHEFLTEWENVAKPVLLEITKISIYHEPIYQDTIRCWKSDNGPSWK